MKTLFMILAVTFSLSVFAQTENSQLPCIPVVPTVKNQSMIFAWDNGTNAEGNWEVQASRDGKTFKTVGIVWGTGPNSNNCQFKLQVSKLTSRYKAYRVVNTSAVQARP